MPGDFSKSHAAFSATEMETATLFVDFIQGLSSKDSNNRDSILGDGIIAVIPSENSDKTYMARMLLDLKKIKVTETESLYDLLKEGNLSRIEEF